MKKQEQQLSYATGRKNMIKLKVVFVGDQATGKSSIINRFIKNEFDPNHNPTVGIDFVSKNITIGGSNIRLQLWDTAGQQRFRSLIPTYLRDSQAVLIVYDVTNIESFESVSHWIDFIKQYRDEEINIFIVGNKIDRNQDKVVHSNLVTDKFKNISIHHFEVSAKDGTNLQELFFQVCSVILQLTDIQSKSIEIEKNKMIDSTIQKRKKQLESSKGTKINKNNEKINSNVTQKKCC